MLTLVRFCLWFLIVTAYIDGMIHADIDKFCLWFVPVGTMLGYTDGLICPNTGVVCVWFMRVVAVYIDSVICVDTGEFFSGSCL